MVKHGENIFSMRNWIFAQLNMKNNNMNTCGFDGETCCFSLQKKFLNSQLEATKRTKNKGMLVKVGLWNSVKTPYFRSVGDGLHVND